MTKYCHLSYEDRKNIEDGLNQNKSINQIAKEINKSHSTVLREIDRNKIYYKPSNWNNCYNDKCKDYSCVKLLKSPHVCNGCKSRSGCRKERFTYYARKANDSYKDLISSCRQGINLTDEEIYNIIKQNERKQIIAFVGRAGSGKDYQCNLLKEKGFTKMAFADALRDIAFSSFDIPYAFGMERYEEMKANEDCIKVVTEDSVHKVSFRKFLELLGTQGIRKYDNDFWCRALIKTLKDKQYKKVCISDMRFINEYTYLKKFAQENDYVFKVLFCNYRSNRYQDNNTHESARLANYFCTHGYTDLQEITDDDMQQAFEKFTKVLV